MHMLILIGNAERPEIAPTEGGNNVVLTEHGTQDTTQHAKAMSREVVSMVTSPIERCVEILSPDEITAPLKRETPL